MTGLQELWRRLLGPFGASALLVAFYCMLIAVACEKSPVMDEPLHAAAGYTYWKFGDYRIQPENGVLPQRWFGLALLSGDVKPPSFASPNWLETRQWNLSYEWLHLSGNDPSTVLLRGRAAAALLTVALGALVWLWAARLFGSIGGMLSLLLFVLDPTVLANGALLTSDVCGALFFLLSLWATSRALEKFGARRVLVSALALAGLFLAKMSAPLVLPVLAVMLGARLVAAAPLALGSGRVLASRTQRAVALAAGVVLHAVIVFGAIWAAYGFRYRAFALEQTPSAHFDRPWEWALDQPDHFDLVNQLELTPDQARKITDLLTLRGALNRGWTQAALVALAEIKRDLLTPAQARRLEALQTRPPGPLPARLIEFARRHELLPEAYLFGYAHVWKLASERTSFLNGEISNTGWRAFFPFTFLVKTPLATLLLLAIAGVSVVVLRRRAQRADETKTATGVWLGLWPLGLFAALYSVAAIFSHINIGHRHILPVYPPLFVFAGAAGAWLAAEWKEYRDYAARRLAGATLLAALVCALAVETAKWFPNYLSYFNGLVRPSRAYRHLIDSSLDWGQDLPAIRSYLQQHPTARQTYLAYFGMGSPSYYGIAATQIFGHPGFEMVAQPPLRVVPNVFPDRDRAQLEEFRRREPVYDPALVATVTFGSVAGSLLVKQPEALRLTGGTYFISATLIQPLTYSKALGPWNPRLEEAYQHARETVRPLLVDDVRARANALGTHSVGEWLQAFDDYYQFRFARLTAYLRKREPDDTVNYSILVYRLSDDDITRALEGPPP